MEPTDEPTPKRGRPLTPIDEDGVRRLAKLGCTCKEIGDWFGVSGETIRSRFLDVLKLARADQKMSLRRMQWKSAREGSVPMLIHLGKHVLGQRDKVANEHRFGFGRTYGHEDALDELDRLDAVDPAGAKAKLLHGIPDPNRITIEFVRPPARDEAGNLVEPIEADGRVIDDGSTDG